ncbi:MAG: type II toxin-antitoxin system RelE/ParE family toxin [Chloroflexota bacterium]|nr:type II toxin-antitoxin system RelE/ParE family toxin [Chloroflexota bacterium]MDE2688706.1 type II toxin-antitoxin system RelE/ParE family toxin [Chloroflexota bacterium]
MIKTFGDRGTRDLYYGRRSSRTFRFPPNIISAANKKLDMIDAADTLDDLRLPPGNRLHALHGELEGLYSIRVNSRWRIVGPV